MNTRATYLGAGLLAILAPAAQGALQISYSVNGGAPVTCALEPINAGPAVCTSIPVAPVTISVPSASSNSPESPTVAQEFGSTLVIQTTADADLDVWVASQGFLFPVTPPRILFTSSLSTTSTTGPGTADLTSCVDTGNGLAPPLDTFCSPGISVTNTTQNFTAPNATSGTKATLVSSLDSPHSLSQHISLALDAGTNMSVITGIVPASVPEPSSLAVVGCVLLMTSFALRKRFPRQV